MIAGFCFLVKWLYYSSIRNKKGCVRPLDIQTMKKHKIKGFCLTSLPYTDDISW